MNFPTDIESILDRVAAVRPERYGATRNYINGAVTYLSPYISRGVISTKFVLDKTLERGFKPFQIEKFIQELAWRDYWQQIWMAHKEEINFDLRHPQSGITNNHIPEAIVNGQTGIWAIDDAIHNFYDSGYLHNHLRMYIAAIACNIGGSYWLQPARWMYYHLKDADWASNALSWQWVAGANSNKKYIANQENINKYCLTDQQGTFLDVSYEQLATMEVPKELQQLSTQSFTTDLPSTDLPKLDASKKTLIYNFYNLDPFWHQGESTNRILLLEPSVFEKYPISPKTLNWVLELAQNIQEVQVYVGEFAALEKVVGLSELVYKEHPLNNHYSGTCEARDWMFDVQGTYRSFFAFWKRCKKKL